MSKENRERARGLMTDIEMGNPQYAKQLVKQHGKTGALKVLEKILDGNDKTKKSLEETLLKQMPKTNDPYERMAQERQAHELAQELAYEEIRELYNPTSNEDNPFVMTEEDAQEFRKMLRQ